MTITAQHSVITTIEDDNPFGRAIVCWTPYLGIMCFVRGTEA